MSYYFDSFEKYFKKINKLKIGFGMLLYKQSNTIQIGKKFVLCFKKWFKIWQYIKEPELE